MLKHITQEEYEAAGERGRIADETEPRATAARYDKKSRRVVVDLKNGVSICVPPEMIDRNLRGVSDEDLSEVEVLGFGIGLEWERINAGCHIPGLIESIFGPDAWAKQAAKPPGQSKSPGKQDAIPANGAKAGRARRSVATTKTRGRMVPA